MTFKKLVQKSKISVYKPNQKKEQLEKLKKYLKDSNAELLEGDFVKKIEIPYVISNKICNDLDFNSINNLQEQDKLHQK